MTSPVIEREPHNLEAYWRKLATKRLTQIIELEAEIRSLRARLGAATRRAGKGS